MPRMIARIPASGKKPDWTSSFGAEAFFISFFLGIAAFALTLNIYCVYAGFGASPLLGWLARLLTRKHEAAASH